MNAITYPKIIRVAATAPKVVRILVCGAPNVDRDDIWLPEWSGAHADGSDATVPMLNAIETAREQGLTLYGRGREYNIATLPELGGSNLNGNRVIAPGTYRWRNIKFYSEATTSGPIFSFRPAVLPMPEVGRLTADAEVGDKTLQIAPGAALVPGQRYLLVEKSFYKSALAADYSNKSVYVTAQAVDATTVDLYEPLIASFAVANTPTLFLASYDIDIDFADVSFRRTATTGTQDCLYLTCCNILNCQPVHLGMHHVWGVYARMCSHLGEMGGTAVDAPSGYGFGSTGGDNPKVGVVTARRMRHTVEHGGDRGTVGVTPAIDGVTVGVTGRGGYTRRVHCDDSENAIYDMHPGHFGHNVGQVTGNVRSDAPVTSAVVLESPDVHIESLEVDGANGGLSIQYYGKGIDEMPTQFSCNDIRSRGFAGSDAALLIQNRDSTNHTPLACRVGSIAGDFGGAVVTLLADISTDLGGDIFCTFDQIAATSRGDVSTILCKAGTHGRVDMRGRLINLRNLSGDASAYCVHVIGDGWEAVHAGEPGATFSADQAWLYRKHSPTPTNVDFMVRSDNAIVRLGRDWQISADTGLIDLPFMTGAGGVQPEPYIGQLRSVKLTADPAYVPQLLDSGRQIMIDSAGAATLTVPNDSTVNFRIGIWIQVLQYGPGRLTIAPAGGVTLRSASGYVNPRVRYSVVTLTKLAANEWSLSGDLGPP